jgi:hypothetical protein
MSISGIGPSRVRMSALISMESRPSSGRTRPHCGLQCHEATHAVADDGRGPGDAARGGGGQDLARPDVQRVRRPPPAVAVTGEVERDDPVTSGQ